MLTGCLMKRRTLFAREFGRRLCYPEVVKAEVRKVINRSLSWAPVAIGGAFIPLATLALSAIPVWPDIKTWMEESLLWLLAHSKWISGFCVVFMTLWLFAWWKTRDRDDASTEGKPMETPTERQPKVMTTDNRKGIFNDAPNYGTQNFNDGVQPRSVPASLANALASIPRNVTIQVRIYGMEHEMQALGHGVARLLASAGLKVIEFDQDHGTRFLKGIVIEPAPNPESITAGRLLTAAFLGGGLQATMGHGPESWQAQKFVRIGIGGNTP